MRYLLTFLLSIIAFEWSTAQDFNNYYKELNWINLSSFKKDVDSFPADDDKLAVVIYANEIKTGDVDSLIQYTSQVNCLKNVYIFANKITFSGKLHFKLSGILLKQLAYNFGRDGGTLVIYANTAEFLDDSVLDIETFGAYKDNNDNKGVEVDHSTNVQFGGNGGRVFLVFENIKFDESRIITKSIDSLNAIMNSTMASSLISDIDTTKIPIDTEKEALFALINDLGSSLGDEFQRIYKPQHEAKIAVIKLAVKDIKYWKDFTPVAIKLIRDYFFDLALTDFKLILNASKDFGDLNKGSDSQFRKLTEGGLMGFHWGPSVPTIAENFFVSYRGLPGQNFTTDMKEIYPKGLNERSPKFKFYNNLINFLNENNEFEEVADRWLIQLLKDVKVKLEKSIKNSDYGLLLNTINYYNSLPDFNVSNEGLLDTYSGLLKEINGLRDKYNLKTIQLKNNVIQELKEGKINYYAQPGFSLTRNYYVDNVEKLAISQIDVDSKILHLDFNIQLIPTIIDINFAKQAGSMNKGVYAGMYINWTLESYELPLQGIDIKNSTIVKDGDFLSCKFVFINDYRVPLALIFGNGNFFVKLNCYSNTDKDFKFQITIPINFRYRTVNHLKLVDKNTIQNMGSDDVLLNGIINFNDNLVTFDPVRKIPPTQSIKFSQNAKYIPSEMIESVMPIAFNDNFKYFNDLTENRQFIKEMDITNNFPLTSSNGNLFQRLELSVKYSPDGTSTKELKLEFDKPHEKQTYPIFYVLNDPQFTVEGRVVYENEIINIKQKKISDWNIILDQSLTP